MSENPVVSSDDPSDDAPTPVHPVPATAQVLPAVGVPAASGVVPGEDVPRARTDAPEVSDADVAVLAEQLGRPPRGVVAIAARCVCGRPLVVRTAPRLDDGTPFPTTYYLTCPPAVGAVSTLEASGLMKELTARLATDAGLAAAYGEAHEAYLRDREALGHVPEIAGVSAGGMPTRVKCLHVLVGHALAAGPGVNPVGDEVLVMLRDAWRPDRCTC